MVPISRNLKRYIYLISPNKIYPNFYIELAKVLASKKVSFFQLRLKNQLPNKIIKIAKKIRKITQKYKVKLIINDNSEIAKKINADGCHLGQADENINSARKKLKEKLLESLAMDPKNLL